MIDWATHNLIPLGQFLTALGTVVGIVGGLWIKNKHDDNSLQKYVMRVMQQQNRETNADTKQAKHDYQELRQLYETAVRQLNEQIGLKEDENQRLRAKIRLLKAENDAYHAKYGGIEYEEFLEKH